MNDRSRIAAALVATCLLLLGSCGIAGGRTERKLAAPGRAIERFVARGGNRIESRLGSARRTLGRLPGFRGWCNSSLLICRAKD